LFSLLKFLIYAIAAVVLLTLILSNNHPVTLELFILPPITVPLYAPIALAFAVGLGIGLLYAFKCAVFRRALPPSEPLA